MCWYQKLFLKNKKKYYFNIFLNKKTTIIFETEYDRKVKADLRIWNKKKKKKKRKKGRMLHFASVVFIVLGLAFVSFLSTKPFIQSSKKKSNMLIRSPGCFSKRTQRPRNISSIPLGARLFMKASPHSLSKQSFILNHFGYYFDIDMMSWPSTLWNYFLKKIIRILF